MSQEDVLELLESHPNDWLNTTQMYKLLNYKISIGSIRANVNRLSKANLVRKEAQGLSYIYKLKEEQKDNGSNKTI